MEHMTRRRCVAMTMGGLPVLAGLAAYTAGAPGSWGETELPRFQKVGAGSARAEIRRSGRVVGEVHRASSMTTPAQHR
jgi:hypothetical protein